MRTASLLCCLGSILLPLLGACGGAEPAAAIAGAEVDPIQLLVDRLDADPTDGAARAEVFAILRRRVQGDLDRRDWEHAASRLDWVRSALPGAADEAGLAASEESLRAALADEFAELEGALAAELERAPGAREGEALLRRFDALRADRLEAHLEPSRALYERGLELSVRLQLARLEEELPSADPRDRIALQNRAAEVVSLRSDALSLPAGDGRESLLERVLAVEGRVTTLLLQPGMEASRRYNLRALDNLERANEEYDSNTGIWNDDEDALMDMLVRNLGPIESRYLDPPTALIYGELLHKTLDQLGVDQKIQVVERMARTEKWTLARQPVAEPAPGEGTEEDDG